MSQVIKTAEQYVGGEAIEAYGPDLSRSKMYRVRLISGELRFEVFVESPSLNVISVRQEGLIERLFQQERISSLVKALRFAPTLLEVIETAEQRIGGTAISAVAEIQNDRLRFSIGAIADGVAYVVVVDGLSGKVLMVSLAGSDEERK